MRVIGAVAADRIPEQLARIGLAPADLCLNDDTETLFAPGFENDIPSTIGPHISSFLKKHLVVRAEISVATPLNALKDAYLLQDIQHESLINRHEVPKRKCERVFVLAD